MYENKKQLVVPISVFYKRLIKNGMVGLGVLFVCLVIGVTGYHYTADIGWLDSLHNASMILSGMGPVVPITTVSGKWFSSMYALFSGVIFITNIGVFLAPVIHRFFHKLHVEN